MPDTTVVQFVHRVVYYQLSSAGHYATVIIVFHVHPPGFAPHRIYALNALAVWAGCPNCGFSWGGAAEAGWGLRGGVIRGAQVWGFRGGGKMQVARESTNGA